MVKFNAIHTVICEDPWQKMWDHFLYFETEPTVIRFLSKRYEQLSLDESHDELAKRNAHKMIYLSKQAREYFHSGISSSLLVRPLLLYYGMVNLAKMLILSFDPYYPSHTKLLAHGITTRKVKKEDYHFLQDEVKLQKDGLLPHLMQLLTGQKRKDSYFVKELIALIPELRSTFHTLYQENVLMPIYISDEFDTDTLRTSLFLPLTILTHKGLSLQDFVEYVNQYNTSQDYFTLGPVFERQNIFQLYWHSAANVHVFDSPSGFSNPLFIRDLMGRYSFWLKPEERLMLPEVTIHLLAMYVLGMLCRYDGDLWGKMHFSFYSQDLYIIQEFIHISPRKYPNLILNLLFGEIYDFRSS